MPSRQGASAVPEALRPSNFNRFIELAPDGIVVIDTEGRIVAANAQMESLFGWTSEELVGQTMEILLPERFRGAHLAHRASYFSAPRLRTMGQGLDLYGLRKDGTEFPVDISLGPIDTDEGLFVAAAIRDMTEQRRAEELSRRVYEVELRHRQAFELNDAVVQGLSVALLALDADEIPTVKQTLKDTLERAKAIVSGMMSEDAPPAEPDGRFARAEPALADSEEVGRNRAGGSH